MALMIGASLFVLWRWTYSVLMVLIGAAFTALFIYQNPLLPVDKFFLNGGLLLAASAAFMVILINARYNLTVREIKTRVALADTISILQSQAEEIKSINENLERLVNDRTSELEAKNKAIEEYTFITAHRLRGPVASVLGLINIFRSFEIKEDAKEAITHLESSTRTLDDIVTSMLRAIESQSPERGEERK
jgi:signal transduction histidine kinase